MADNTNSEIVELIIDAKNLAKDELIDVANELRDLGNAARQAEKDLDRLKIQSDTLQSYQELGDQVKQMRTEVDKAEIAYQQMEKTLKENKSATDDQKLAVRTAKRELADLKRELADQEKTYRAVTKAAKSYDLDLKDLTKSQAGLREKITEAESVARRQQQLYKDQADSLRTRIAAEKEARASAEAATAAEAARVKELERLAVEQKKAEDATDRAAAAEQKRAQQQAAAAKSLRDYEAQLRQLNIAYEQGTISTADYIRNEDKLRQSLELTEGQTRTVRAALKAETADREKVRSAIQKQIIELEKLEEQFRQSAETARLQRQTERETAQEADRVKAAVVEYEAQLSRLNREKQEGVITSGQYIRKESELRQQLRLTEQQVKTTRAAIQADAAERGRGVSNTDLLTTATRRLAQAYTVLIAAQTAAQGVGTSIAGYGELETAITKVEKTTGLLRTKTEQLAETLSDLSKNITPTATTELLRYAEVAGQLGTKSTADILNLVSAADALENSTNLAGDAAVEILARILTMTGEGIPAIQNLASSVVALGNDFAATEADIVQMTKEIVTGTREIGLGSSAAAAFGVTLAELGQPAERSRTAIQRLAGSIKEASLKGGEDLERISMITKMTGDEIQKNLGETPEKVLLAFLQGLKEVGDQGGQMSFVLQRMGIDGTEALSVLSTLAGGVGRLETALKLSNEKWVDGNAHMQEAAKAYANQESAIRRLGNEFGGLTKAIGEAYSDETDAAVRSFTEVIRDNGEAVIQIMERIPEALSGLGEVLQIMDQIISTVTSDDEGLGIINTILETATLNVNGLTRGLSVMLLGLQDATLSAYELYNSLQPLSDLQIGTDRIEALKKTMAETRASVQRDTDDMRRAVARLNGESSLAFEDLLVTAEKYNGVLNRLSREQQIAINTIVQTGQYREGENDTYRELTAAIVRANRELEIEQNLKKSKITQQQQSTQATKSEAVAVTELADAQSKANVSAEEYARISGLVRDSQQRVIELWRTNTITADEAVTAYNGLTTALNGYTVSVDQEAAATGRQTKAMGDNLAQRRQLFADYQAGRITQQQLVDGINRLTDSFSNNSSGISFYTSQMQAGTLAQAKFADEILQTTKKIADYQAELKAGNLLANERARLNAELAVSQEKLRQLQADQAETIRVENATYRELITIQREYEQQLAELEKQFRQGILTKAEYEEKTRSLQAALSEITAVIGDNTAVVEDNTEALEQNADALDNQTKSAEKNAEATKNRIQFFNALRGEQDFLGKSTADLNKTLADQERQIQRNMGAYASTWFNEFAKATNATLENENAIIRNIIAVRNWTAQVEQGGLTLAQLDRLSRDARGSIRDLSQEQLTPLLNAIARAKSELLALNSSIDDALRTAQDRIDEARGNQEGIIKRRFESELQQYSQLLAQAQTTGDQALIQKAQQTISQLKQAQQLELQQFKAEQKAQANQVTQQQQTTTSPVLPGNQVAAQSGSGGVAVLQLQIPGMGTYNVNADQSTINKLLADVNRATKLGG